MNPFHVQTLIDGTLKFVELASFAVKRAVDEVTVRRQMQKKAADLAPEVLELMIKTGAVRADQREAAAAMLGDHGSTMMLLKTSVEELYKARSGDGRKKAADLGGGVDDPGERNGRQDGYDSLNDPFVGRRTSQKKASDVAIMAVLDDPHR